jgi:hypothetical protein
MGVLWCLLLYAERSRPWLALLAGLAIAAGPLIRYAAWFWLPVGCTAIVVARPGLPRGLRDGLILAAATLIPNLLWLYRCGSVRRVAWHPPSREKLAGAIDTLDHWDLSLVLWALLVVAVILAPRALWKPVVLLVAAVASYAVLLALALFLFDAAVPLNWRMLSPAAPIVVALVAMGMRAVPDGLRRIRPGGQLVRQQVVATLLVLALLPWNDWWRSARRTVDTFRANGGGLLLRGHHASPTLAAIAELSGSIKIWAYWPTAVRVGTGKRSDRIPWKFDPVTGQARPEFEREMAEMIRAVAKGRGVVVWRRRDSQSTNQPTPDEMAALFDQYGVRRLEDGIIWGRAGAPPHATRPTTMTTRE